MTERISPGRADWTFAKWLGSRRARPSRSLGRAQRALARGPIADAVGDGRRMSIGTPGPSLVPMAMLIRCTREPSIGARLFDGERRALLRPINRSDAACSVAAGALSPACWRVGLAGRPPTLLYCAIRRYRVPRFQYKISASFGSVRSLAAPPRRYRRAGYEVSDSKDRARRAVTSADFCLGRRCRWIGAPRWSTGRLTA
jgi:hypothetical protein